CRRYCSAVFFIVVYCVDYSLLIDSVVDRCCCSRLIFFLRRSFRAIDELDSRRAVSSSACTGGAAAPTPGGGLPPPSPFIGTYSARPVLYGSGGRSGGKMGRAHV